MEGVKRKQTEDLLVDHSSYPDKKDVAGKEKKYKIEHSSSTHTVDSFLASKETQNKLLSISKRDFPFFFGLKTVNKDFIDKDPITVSSEIIPDDDALLGFCFDKEIGVQKKFLSEAGQDIAIFVIKNETSVIERIGTVKDIIDLNSSSKPYVSSLLAISNPEFSKSKDLIVEAAAIFHGGIFVKRDKLLAARLLQKIGDHEEIKHALTNALLVACSDERSIAITRALLELGANSNGVNDAGYSTLENAFRGGGTGNSKTLEVLMDFGAVVGQPIGIWNISFSEMLYGRAKTDPKILKSNIMQITQKKLKEEEWEQTKPPDEGSETKL